MGIGGTAQWGASVAPWDDLTDVESRVQVYLESSFPEVASGGLLSWKDWKSAFMCRFRMSEPVLGTFGGVRDHVLVRDYEESMPPGASHQLAHVPTSDCVALIARHVRSLGTLPLVLA